MARHELIRGRNRARAIDRSAAMTGTRVCHLGKYYPPAAGGIESHVRTLAHAQADLGLAGRVCRINPRDGPPSVEADGPVEVTRLGRSASVGKLDVCPDLAA